MLGSDGFAYLLGRRSMLVGIVSSVFFSICGYFNFVILLVFDLCRYILQTFVCNFKKLGSRICISLFQTTTKILCPVDLGVN